MNTHFSKSFYFLTLISLFAFTAFLPNSASAAVTVTLEAGTPAGWDFYDLDADLAKNNTVDWNDLGVIASHWLNAGCSDVNQWCAGADLDSSTDVDFLDYALLSKDWARVGAKNVLLQTIYGTNQNSTGTIIANTSDAIENLKGNAMAFRVEQNTTLDKAIFKCSHGGVAPGWRADDVAKIRLYNVTGQNYLSWTGSTNRVSRATPGGSGTLVFEALVTVASNQPSHFELGETTRFYADMIINFNKLDVTAGEYLICFDKEAGSSSFGASIIGTVAADIVTMGNYGDGTPLPKRAVATTATSQGNTFFYELNSSTAGYYTARAWLYAFQITIANKPPTINAGTDQTVQYPAVANLSATASDDGFPDPPAAFTTAWSKVSGPGTVTFGNTSALNTTAEFSQVGTYVLRLTADDGALINTDDITIIYTDNHAPVVNAGTDATVGILDATSLDATVTDDSLPNPPSTVTTLWTQQSGPGTATFGNINAVDTSISFSEIGTYVLRLTADDSDMITYDEVTIEVVAGSLNSAPVVNAGIDQIVTEPEDSISLDATVSDDGRPIPPGALTTTWTKESGPGTVTFGNIHNVDTGATFSEFGTYVLRLTASDGALVTYDELTVIYRPYTYEGYGPLTTGGEGGTEIFVTNLNDSGAGSLRAALESCANAIIKFNVSGTIYPLSSLWINANYTTVAGETAPGSGITINGSNCDDPPPGGSNSPTLGISGHDLILRNLRIRFNGINLREIIQINSDHNLILDHLSVGGGNDGQIDINNGIHHITLSRCIIANGVEGHRSYGQYASLHHNLYHMINRRQPKIVNTVGPYDFRNNVVQYWTGNGTNVEAGHQVNIINNYFGPPEDGPCSGGFHYEPNSCADVYIAGNYFNCGTDINGIGDKTTPNEEPPVTTMAADDNLRDNVRGDCGALPRDDYDIAIAGPAN